MSNAARMTRRLKFRITRRTKRPAQLERHPQRTRRLGILGLRSNKTDCNGRKPLFLEIVSQRAHGARAHWSNRAEEDAIDLVTLQMSGELASMGLHLYRIARPHKRVMIVGDRADHPLRRELLEPLEREGDVPILLQPGAIEIDRNVANQQLLRPVSAGMTR